MKVYGSPFSPATTALVRPILPVLAGGALVPGPPCPCSVWPLNIGTEANTMRVDKNSCPGPLSRTTTTTYTKREAPGFLSPAEEASWDAAWDTMTHTVVEEMENMGDPYSYSRVWNEGSSEHRSEYVPCPLLLVVEDTWEPGAPDGNPGEAGYDIETEIEEVDTPPVTSVELEAFEGSFVAGGNSGFIAIRDDSFIDEGAARKSEWRWIINLAGWPASRPWPSGLVVKGLVVWDQVEETTDYDADVVTRSVATLTEAFEITEDARVWRGEVRATIPPTSVAAQTGIFVGNYALPTNFLPFT